MSVVGQFTNFESVSVASQSHDPASAYRVDETYWGYIIRPVSDPSRLLAASQAASWLVGISCLVAALGLWMMPSMAFGGGVLEMRLGATAMVLSVAAFCLWYASRGSDLEIQIDTRLGELREVVRNRAGRSSLLGRHGFDAIGAVFVDMNDGAGGVTGGHGSLVLRHLGTSHLLQVATGPMMQLGPLRDRLGRDLMLSPSGVQRAPVPVPRFAKAA